MKILIISNFFPPFAIGGAEVVAERQAKALLARGHDIIVIGGRPARPGIPAGSLEPESGHPFPVYRLAIRSLDPDLSFRWHAVAEQIRCFILLENIDIIHAHNLVGIGVPVLQIAQECNVPCVLTLHDYWGMCLRQTLLRPDQTVCQDIDDCHLCLQSIHYAGQRLPIRLRRDYVAWAIDQASALIAPSSYLADTYNGSGLLTSEVQPLSNGIDVDSVPEHHNESGIVRFLCSSYLGSHKGIHVLLEAIDLLSRDKDLEGKWKVILAGDGSLRKDAEVLQEKNDGLLEVIGHVPRAKIMALLPDIDVVMLPSVWPENEPVTLMEGAAAGKALLVTSCGGSGRFVEAEETGLIVSPGSAAELVAAMKRLIQEEGLARRLGVANGRRRQSLDEALTITRLENLYRSLEKGPWPTHRKSTVVRVSGVEPPAGVQVIIDNLGHMLECKKPLRLLRHDWVKNNDWDETRIIWIWGKEQAEELCLEGVRRGIPVISAPHCGAEAWVGLHKAVYIYKNALEALAYLQILLGHDHIRAELEKSSGPCEEAVWAAPPLSFALYNQDVH